MVAETYYPIRNSGTAHGMGDKECKGRTVRARAFKIVYTECVYAVWLKQNQRVFEKKARDYEVIAREITCMCSVQPICS